MNMLMSAAQQRQELIARVLAETAIKRLYRMVYRAIKRACAGPLRPCPVRAFHFAAHRARDSERTHSRVAVSWPRLSIGQQRCANGSLLRKPSAFKHHHSMSTFAAAFKSAESVWLRRHGRGIASLLPIRAAVAQGDGPPATSGEVIGRVALRTCGGRHMRANVHPHSHF
jgi:hypothetical protein